MGQQRAQGARTRTTRDWGAVGADTRGGAHLEHADRARDAGRVEAHRLVEGRRALPRSKAGHVMLGEVCGPEGGGAKGRGAAAGAGGAHARTRTTRATGGLCGGRARAAERTRNMANMFVTPEVSQSEMSALKSVI